MGKIKELESLKVRATRDGTYGHGLKGEIYRREGDVFTITPREVAVLTIDPKTDELVPDGTRTKMLTCMEQFSERWMEIVENSVPELMTTAQMALDRRDDR